MKFLDQVCAWLLVVLGAFHGVVTFGAYHHASYAALWFFGSGMFLVLAGLVNASRASSGRATGLFYFTALFANLATILMGLGAMFLFFGVLTHNPQVPAIFVLGVAELMFTLRGGR